MAQQPNRPSRQRYNITKKIDAGGMAEIFLGTAESIEGIKRQVAIKRILPKLVKDENFIDMFLDEARLSMLLTHANIVQVFDVGRSGDTYFIVMEFVDGYNLRRVFQKAVEVGYRIPLEIACFIMMETCKGLAHAHEKTDETGKHLHIVHRDLSPPNIMISKSGEVKITDFGLAKAMTQLTVTDPGVVKGKFSYLSPEATEGQTVDHRADVFAAGVVLWEILANRRLFLGKSDQGTVELVRKAEVPPLSKFNAEVTDEFERIVNRALARDPRKRYTSAREFGEAIANYLFTHNLKVTGYDLAGMVQRLFGAGAAEGLDSPGDRIATLIQDEILSLAMLGYSSQGGVDGSRPLDPEALRGSGQQLVDFTTFWKPSAASAPGAPRAQSGEELARMLEGDSLVQAGDGGGSKTGLIIGVAVAVLAAAAAAVYFLVLAK